MDTENQQVAGVACAQCGKAFKNKQAVNGHLSHCPGRPAVAAAPAFVAEVPVSPILPPKRAQRAVAAAAAIVAAVTPAPELVAPPASSPPAFVAEVQAPPPPAPPAAAEVTQYVPRMPLPDPSTAPGGMRAENWQPDGGAPAQLQPLHTDQPVSAAPPAAMVAPNSPPPTVTVHQAEPQAGSALATVDAEPVVDIVKVMEVFSKRIFTWEGSGPITKEEGELLRQVITWKPGPASAAAVIISGVFLPRILTHPAISGAIIAKLNEFIGDDDDDTAAPTGTERAAAQQEREPEPEPERAAAPAASPSRDDQVRRSWAERGVDVEAETTKLRDVSATKAGRGAA